LQQHPQSAQGWYLLGRIYLSQQQFAAAVSAFTTAYKLQPQNPTIVFYYKKSLSLAQQSLEK
jgi:cytochrome c-type biogenesis protein CcmH/NrfG